MVASWVVRGVISVVVVVMEEHCVCREVMLTQCEILWVCTSEVCTITIHDYVNHHCTIPVALANVYKHI